MPRWIEFHDSTLVAIRLEATEVVVSLKAYVHDWERVDERWVGTGWSQPVVIHIGGAYCVLASAIGIGISDGSAEVGAKLHDNMITLPFESTEPARLRFILVSGERVEVDGEGILIESCGDAVFVEDIDDCVPRPFQE